MKKFIYCTDENLKNKLEEKLAFISKQTINGKDTWIFENSSKIVFSDIDMSKLRFTNKLYI